MSDAEFEVLTAGGRLMNATDHAKERGQLTDSIGFCFFTEDPDKAIHWLSAAAIPTTALPSTSLTTCSARAPPPTATLSATT